jgi:hypothetical protein
MQIWEYQTLLIGDAGNDERLNKGIAQRLK